MNDRKTMASFLRKHKTELIVIGASAVAVLGAVLLVRNWDDIVALIPKGDLPREGIGVQEIPIDPLPKTMTEAVVPDLRIEYVPWHPRRLPIGQNASQTAIDKAIAHNFVLDPGYTFVSDYTRPRVA